MPEINEIALKDEIKQRNFRNAYLIYGTEPYLKQYYANLIASKCVSKDFEGFNLRKFDYENKTDIDELIAATDTLPAFDEYSCALMKDFPLDSFFSGDKEKFEDWIKEMPETTVAVFWQDSGEINPKKNAKWNNVINIFNKYGAVVCLDKYDRMSLAKIAASGFKKRGCIIDRETALYLVDTVGDDLNILQNEVDKLANFVGKDGTVTKEYIDKVSVKSLEATVFDLSKALFSKNLSKAFEILNKLFNDKEKPEMIFGALSSNFIDMYRTKISLLEGKSADYLKDAYGYRNTAFRLRNARANAQYMDIADIKRCINILSKADFQLKNRSVDPKLILEKLLLELDGVISR